MTSKVVLGNSLDVLRKLPDNYVHAVVTDPPYGLSNTDTKHVTEALTQWVAGNREFVPDVRGGGFMGKDWDSFVPPPALWDEVMRVLKPGGHLLCFSGSRTIGLMEMSIRLSGLEIRDSLAWLYGSGMPKGAKLDGDWKGWHTSLKPAFEPILLARKPFPGSIKNNVLVNGVGALNIDATRIPHRNAADLAESTGKNQHADFGTEAGRNKVYGDYTMVEVKNYDGAQGRHPTNVILDEEQAAVLDEQSGITKSTKGKPRGSAKPGEGWGMTKTGAEYDDIGGASRFFYVAKANSKERPVVDGIAHPTVKPLDLMRYLVKLVTPAGGFIVDPFAGSGTTVEAAIMEGFNVLGIEQDETYIPLINERVERANNAH